MLTVAIVVGALVLLVLYFRLLRWMSTPRRVTPHEHGDHTWCSLYSPCRADDLEADWQAFKRAMANPAINEAVANAELHRIATISPHYKHLTYDPFTFKSRRY